MLQVEVKGVIPTRGSADAAGYDLYCNDSSITILSNTCKLISTGTYMSIPKGYYGKIESRSSIASKQNCHVGAGVIDSDYRGEIKVLMRNDSKEEVKFTYGMRIAQIIILKHEVVEFIQTDKLEKTERNEGGFGSTDVLNTSSTNKK